MNYVPKIDRRSFVVGTAAAGAGLTLGMTLPFGAGACAAGHARAQCLGRGETRRHRRCPLRPLRDGPGRADRPLPAGRRRARVRLVESQLGICRPAREHPPQARLRQLQLHRLERDPPVARLCAPRRRGGAADADPGRRQRVESAGLGMHGGEQRHHPHADRAARPATARSRTRRRRSNRRIRRASRSRTPSPGRSPASRSRASTPGTSSPASRSTRSTPSCPAC